MRVNTQQANANPAIREAIENANGRKLPAKPKLDGASEKDVVSEIVTALRLSGYCTPREWAPGARGIFIRIGQRKAKGSGTDEGCPDLLVISLVPVLSESGGTRFPQWLIEVKARTKEAGPSKEQNTLHQLGIIHICNSAGQVLALLER